MQDGHTAWAAAQYFSDCDKTHYDHSMLHQWYRKATQILSTSAAKKRISGGGKNQLWGN